MKRKTRFRLSVLIKILVPLLPLFLAGSVYIEKVFSSPDGTLNWHQLSDALFGTLRIYSLEILENTAVQYKDIQSWSGSAYLRLEIARWLATAVVVATIYKLLKTALTRLSVWLTSSSRYAYALHGDGAPVALLKKELGPLGISADVSEKFQASNHILAFRDPKALFLFLDTHYDQLLRNKHAHVFVCMNETIHSAQLDRRIVISDMTKNCARLYWKKHPLHRQEREVVIIGMGRYGSQLLSQALQTNVFLEEREIVYHVFGDSGAYQALHPQLHQVAAINGRDPGRDSVIFHQEPWYQAQDVPAKADRVILCADEETDNFAVMDYLLEHGLCSKIHIKVNRAGVVQALWQYKDRVIPFGTDKDLYSIEQVTHAALNSRAQLAHAYYAHRYCEANTPNPVDGCPAGSEKSGSRLSACLTCPKFQADWSALSAYKRSSSIALDDHVDVKIRELLDVDLSAEDAIALIDKAYQTYCNLPEERKLQMCAMEHRRWMRFLFMHGWRYGEKRNDEKRIHPMLKPFDQLSVFEQKKDEDTYLVLAEIKDYMEYHKNMLVNI